MSPETLGKEQELKKQINTSFTDYLKVWLLWSAFSMKRECRSPENLSNTQNTSTKMKTCEMEDKKKHKTVTERTNFSVQWPCFKSTRSIWFRIFIRL